MSEGRTEFATVEDYEVNPFFAADLEDYLASEAWEREHEIGEFFRFDSEHDYMPGERDA